MVSSEGKSGSPRRDGRETGVIVMVVVRHLRLTRLGTVPRPSPIRPDRTRDAARIRTANACYVIPATHRIKPPCFQPSIPPWDLGGSTCTQPLLTHNKTAIMCSNQSPTNSTRQPRALSSSTIAISAACCSGSTVICSKSRYS